MKRSLFFPARLRSGNGDRLWMFNLIHNREGSTKASGLSTTVAGGLCKIWISHSSLELPRQYSDDFITPWQSRQLKIRKTGRRLGMCNSDVTSARRLICPVRLVCVNVSAVLHVSHAFFARYWHWSLAWARWHRWASSMWIIDGSETTRDIHLSGNMHASTR